jgi:hypothetical protein
MADTKDLKYYLAHPDEMPEDPKELERLANEQIAQALESGKEQVKVEDFVEMDEKSESSPAPKKEVKEAPKEEAKVESKEAAPKEEPEKEAKPEGVLAKDGKNVIPYAVLEASRRREREATELAVSQAAEIERLKQAEAGKTVRAEQDAAALTEEELKTLEQDSPTLAKLLRAQQTEISGLKTALKGVNERVEVQVEQTESEIKSEIQTAIDANPKMAAWQVAQDQTLWNEAAKIDKLLRENPLYADVPFEKRFAKVVEMTEDAMGLRTQPAPAEAPKPDPAKVKAAAAAKLAKTPTTPRSLSDIPGGAPPAQDEREAVEGMSIVSLGEKFMHMTPEQRDAYLASL